MQIHGYFKLLKNKLVLNLINGEPPIVKICHSFDIKIPVSWQQLAAITAYCFLLWLILCKKSGPAGRFAHRITFALLILAQDLTKPVTHKKKKKFSIVTYGEF